MTKSEYDNIISVIYDNGRVEESNDNGASSEDVEFHFEAKQRGFTDQEIEEARERFA